MTDLTKIVDLHIHSSASDGYHPPEELHKIVQASAKQLAADGLELGVTSLTDHDTLLGLDRMQALCDGGPVRFLPGVELDGDFDGSATHLLVYFPSWNDATRSRIKRVLLPMVEEISRSMDAVISQTMVERVNACGNIRLIPRERITSQTVRGLVEQEDAQYDTDLKAFRAAKWAAVGRLMLQCGYVESMEEMRRHLKPGGCCKCEDVQVPLPYTVDDLIQRLRGNGFVLFLAHPSTVVESLAAGRFSGDMEKGMHEFVGQILRWQEMGLDGIECYSSHSEQDCPIQDFEARMLSLCAKNALWVSGGSDFHGGGKKEKVGVGFGALRVPFEAIRPWYGE